MDQEISEEIADSCIKLNFIFSNGKKNGTDILASCFLPNNHEEIFHNLCISLIEQAKDKDEKQKLIIKEAVNLLKFLRDQSIHNEYIMEYIFKKIILKL